MAIIIIVHMNTAETLFCDNCNKGITEGEDAFLDLDYMRESPRKVYCGVCKEEKYP